VARGRRANSAEIALDVLDMTPTTAVVKVIDGQWKVVAKLFHLYDQEGGHGLCGTRAEPTDGPAFAPLLRSR
jgi:hypothetical protein